MNKHRHPALATFALILIMLVACSEKPATPGGAAPGGAGPAGAAPAAPPSPEVGVVRIAPEAVAIITELPGRLEPSRMAQVRARVAGILQKRLFTEGSDVKAGQLLYQVDSAPYQASLDSALASLARSEANLLQARTQAERYKPLVEANAISKQDYTNAVAAQKQAEADVASGKAAVATARINLGYASVTAPINGRIGRTMVTEGALVGQGEATQLTMIQQINPLYVNFMQSTADVFKLRKSFESGQLKRAAGKDAADIHVLLEDGSPYPIPGRLLFSDLTVDQTSGQIMLRAEVPNPNGLLLPGMYVRVRLEQAQSDAAILIPQQALIRSAQGDSVLVVDADGKVAPRQVKVGSSQGNRWVITAGLAPGEQIVVDGFQKIRPNAPVKPVPWQPPSANPQAGGPASKGGPPAPAAGK